MALEKEETRPVAAGGAATAADVAAAAEVELVDELVAEARGDVFTPPADMPAWMAQAILRIDACTRIVGRVVCWLVVPIFLAMVYEIIARKLFVAPTIWAYDISRMFYGALFMLGSAYGLMRGIHIRADFLYRNLSVHKQGVIDASLYLVFFFPSMLLFLYISGEYAYEAWERGERIDETPWQPLAAPIRTVLFVSVFFLLVQGVSETLKCIYAAWRGKWLHE